jgi:hypothetical protein
VSAGYQLTVPGINNAIGQLAVLQRNLAIAQLRLQETIDALGGSDAARITALQNLPAGGYSAADAADVIAKVNAMANLAGVYYGTVQQGGTGGTGAILYDFDSALASAWGVNLSSL